MDTKSLFRNYTFTGIFWAPYPEWKKIRTFAISTLREEGMGKSIMEPKILDELECYINHFIKPNLGEPLSLLSGLKLATNNLISQMVFGHRATYDDADTKIVISAVSEILSLTGRLSFLTNMPCISWLIRSLENRNHHLMYNIITPIFSRYISEHKTTLDSNHPRDVVDRFLMHSNSAKEEDKHCFTENNLIGFCSQLYSAGYESTANVLAWALLYICLHPEKQKRVQSEIDSAIGIDRCVTLKDRLMLPYTDAVLLETLRKANIAPIAAPHTLQKDLIIDGKLVPAGADVLLNMTSVLYDETVFEEPDEFKPERYLTGDIALKKQRTIPFSMGRRMCAGEGLAKMEIFMFFVTFLQRYNISLPKDSTVTDQPISNGQGNLPPPFQIIFTAREQIV
ncbi:cytochrome P450 2B9-like [Watersipora subatra]|uniref:cytochrome P450 2B9-like n=1 Tax=Watersipora subatra TaxID=2589382 RepID=UPI00355BA584